VTSGDDPFFRKEFWGFFFRHGNVTNTLGHREYGCESSTRLWKSHHHAFDVFQRFVKDRGGVEMPDASADRIERYTTSIIDNDIDSQGPVSGRLAPSHTFFFPALHRYA